VSGSDVSFLKDSSTPVSTAAGCPPDEDHRVFDATKFTSAQLENFKYLKFDTNAEYGIVQYSIRLAYTRTWMGTWLNSTDPTARLSLSHRRDGSARKGRH
jgi:hypothetical protein